MKLSTIFPLSLAISFLASSCSSWESPSPSVTPDPKAVSETKPVEKTDIDMVARELASMSKNINDMIAKQTDFFANQKISDGRDVSQVIHKASILIKDR